MSDRRWVDIQSKNKSDEAQTTSPENPMPEDFDPGKEAVILVRGINNYGDKIYNYVKVSEDNYQKLLDVIARKEKFSMRDYGSIISAGKGMPSKEEREEMAATYNMVTLK